MVPDVLYPPARPQSVGEILDSAFRIFRATLLTCLPYATLAVIAGQLPSIYYLATGRGLMQTLVTQIRDPVWWLLYVLGTLIVIALWGAILLRQYALATGHGAETGEELRTALRRLPATVLLLVLGCLAVAVWFGPGGAFRGAVRYLVYLLALIPASCVALALSSSWPVLLLTGRGAVASMVHSARLTRGSWSRLTLIYTVGLVLLFVLYLLAGMAAGVVAVLVAHGDIAVITAATTVLVVILGALGTPFYCALMLAVLGDLSVRKEGADLARRISAPATP
jgi:hypothetical protein